jgi:AcrR family transcriptional regulator
MNIAKRNLKENLLIDAAEKIFANVGFKNAKMSDIAKEAGITKVTLYSYFQSKENLYMAVTYRAFQVLINQYYATIDANKNKNGLESALALQESFMSFCEQHFLYSETMLEYFALVRSTTQGKDTAKLTEAMMDSIYYRKIQDIQNLPLTLVSKEIQRGISDGSIKSKKSPMFLTIHSWTAITGFAKVIAASGGNSNPIFDTDLSDLKEYSLKLARLVLSNESIQEEL